MRRSPVRRILLLLAALASLVTMGRARAAAGCTPRILVLSAYPAEADAVLGRATFDKKAVVADGHSFYQGTIAGKPVIMAMTGIGLANATQATEAAFAHFTCEGKAGITAVVFSGVAGGGGRSSIGDVTVARRWTLNGKTWRSVDPAMLATADRVAASGAVHLERVTPTGDPACVCNQVPPVQTVDVGRDTKIVVGGDGHSADSTGGKPSPCIPNGGNLFGCEPCRMTQGSVPDAAATMQGALAWISFNFGSQGSSDPTDGHVYEAVDEETAAVQVVADRHHTPFLGFRGISDGPGDPLPLPGFPVEFFFYQQLAADNAATAATAFIAAWSSPIVATPTLPSLPFPLLVHGGRLARGHNGGAAASVATAPTTPSAVLGQRIIEQPAPASVPRVVGAPRSASQDRGVTGQAIAALVALVAAAAGLLRAGRRLSSA
jgi:nucleoside phosphorylase